MTAHRSAMCFHAIKALILILNHLVWGNRWNSCYYRTFFVKIRVNGPKKSEHDLRILVYNVVRYLHSVAVYNSLHCPFMQTIVTPLRWLERRPPRTARGVFSFAADYMRYMRTPSIRTDAPAERSQYGLHVLMCTLRSQIRFRKFTSVTL